ncbi:MULTISPECIES: glucokinase [Prochlorococcus]|uniref:Glucokinase n=1 Tax=Prochlorococcus marinus (strain SARG / CCMP1375 / SS120) TaxID=167539 RepID=Q7VBM7_PROMA|nr:MULTISPECIES: glucokinase [Prochlorococcus]AAQ00110.1 Glucokinase [Prochlorococcus marinus subsp. marinus str. CCMP1375]KGG13906.1 Glucokinase [Prochlorococcus marinus str. LG]KGG19039.1 Glucokinase [Prochlorococcus marinus str. SS2]KGG23421.1 Glucokinase [Prochlorococcus marinus str. SS35]KGG32343.1 Glucokinase [Prochlorococcus marinus str. SS51]
MNLLAADIGGTKTLLGVFRYEGQIKQLYKAKYSSEDWDNFDLMLKDFIANLPSNITTPKYACIGVAGAINNKIVKLTNLNWQISQESLCKTLNTDEVILLNDFSCLVYAIPYLQQKQYKYIQSLKTNLDYQKEGSIFAILGAGTGLGMARGIITKSGLKAIPSEGGHREFSPRNNKEWELCQWLKKDLKLTRLSIERVVSGTGLANIARWRLSQEDTKSHPILSIIEANNSHNFNNKLLPERVSIAAKGGDPIMREVLEMWLSAYGSAAGDLALQELSTEGLWIGGGTAIKHLDGLSSEIFLNSLKNKGRFSEYLEKLPIMVLIDPEAGLFGAACKAHLMTKSNVKIN